MQSIPFRNPVTKIRDTNQINGLVDWGIFHIKTGLLSIFLEKFRIEHLCHYNTYTVDYNDVSKFIVFTVCQTL